MKNFKANEKAEKRDYTIDTKHIDLYSRHHGNRSNLKIEWLKEKMCK